MSKEVFPDLGNDEPAENNTRQPVSPFGESAEPDMDDTNVFPARRSEEDNLTWLKPFIKPRDGDNDNPEAGTPAVV